MKVIKMLMMAAISIMTLSISAQEKAGKKDTLEHTTLYSCKMHPDVKMDKAGKCPQCGMELILSPKEKMKRDVTKNYTCPIHADVISKKPGKCSKCDKDLVLSSKEKMKIEVVKAFSCPMKCEGDKTYDKPGKCPKCNMDLREKKKDDHSDHQH